VRAKIRAIASRKFPDMQLPPSLKEADADMTDAAPDLIKAAVETATAGLRAELDALKATPRPGGPVIVKTLESAQKTAEREEQIEVAARYRRMSETASDRELAAGYEQLAKRAEADLSK
jgi:hypothetical protein